MARRNTSGLCTVCAAETGSKWRYYCARPDCQAVKRSNQNAGTVAANRSRWQEWKATGVDPSHGGAAGEKRGKTIAARNRKRKETR